MKEKQYIALIEGAGEGCDYTIGCNLNWSIFPATNEEEIVKEVKNIYDRYGRENSVNSIELFELVSSSRVLFDYDDLEQLFSKEKEEEEIIKAEEQKKVDEAEFERLKEKLGK